MEETSQDLQQTRQKLSQEEFICSELSSARDSLHSAAGQVHRRPVTSCPVSSGSASDGRVFVLLQLLITVDASTSDVSGLHDKLDRKKKVGAF